MSAFGCLMGALVGSFLVVEGWRIESVGRWSITLLFFDVHFWSRSLLILGCDECNGRINQ